MHVIPKYHHESSQIKYIKQSPIYYGILIARILRRMCLYVLHINLD